MGIYSKGWQTQDTHWMTIIWLMNKCTVISFSSVTYGTVTSVWQDNYYFFDFEADLDFNRPKGTCIDQSLSLQ